MAERLLSTEVTVGEAIVAALADAGVEYVLAMPGGYMRPVMLALHNHPSIQVIQVREESIGTTMAEAYGRVSGRPIVVVGQGQWLAGNAGQGILEAHMGASPLVVLTEMTDGGRYSHHAVYQSGVGEYGGWDARTAFSGVAKRVMVSRYQVQAVQHTQLAIKHALSGEPGPVVVLFDYRALQGTVGPDTKPPIYSTRSYLPSPARRLDEETVDRALRLLQGAENPVIIAGNGVRLSGATTRLLEFARLTDIPVATTASGKGVFPEKDPLAAGTMGDYGSAAANDIVSKSDLLLALGTKLGTSDTINDDVRLIDASRQTIVQIDIEPLNAGWTQPVHLAMVGDVGLVLEQIHNRAAKVDAWRERGSTGAERVLESWARYSELDQPEFVSDQEPILPQRIIRLLEDELPPDTIITCDAGENRIFMMHWFRDWGRGGYLQPAASGGMGYSVRAAMGAKLAAPHRPAVAVSGDGGFALNLHSLMTAIQARIPIVVVIMNNGALGWVVHAMGEKVVAGHFGDFDHAAIARSIGCDAVRVTTVEELRAALASVTDQRDRPFVIEVMTSLEPSAMTVRDSSQVSLATEVEP